MKLPEFGNTVSAVLLMFIAVLMTACAGPQALSRPEYAPAKPVMPAPRSMVDGSIYNANNNRFLFEDIKARRVGDLITVILEEKTNAAKTATTTSSKNSNVNVPSPTLFGLPVTHNGNAILNNTVNSGSDFSGQGDSSQSNSLTGNITVTVSQVLPNGNLIVRGEKLLTLNQGSEVVRISGLVRPVDVTPENTVISTQIANARIAPHPFPAPRFGGDAGHDADDRQAEGMTAKEGDGRHQGLEKSPAKRSGDVQ